MRAQGGHEQPQPLHRVDVVAVDHGPVAVVGRLVRRIEGAAVAVDPDVAAAVGVRVQLLCDRERHPPLDAPVAPASAESEAPDGDVGPRAVRVGDAHGGKLRADGGDGLVRGAVVSHDGERRAGGRLEVAHGHRHREVDALPLVAAVAEAVLGRRPLGWAHVLPALTVLQALGVATVCSPQHGPRALPPPALAAQVAHEAPPFAAAMTRSSREASPASSPATAAAWSAHAPTVVRSSAHSRTKAARSLS